MSSKVILLNIHQYDVLNYDHASVFNCSLFILFHSILELRAYGALLTAFRAAGDLDEEKRDTLSIVRQSLKISDARHKVEVRRVTGNPRLCLIAAA